MAPIDLGIPSMGAPTTTGPSCSTCPSFLEPGEVQGKFRKATGSAMCARYGHVLDKPGSEPEQQERLREVIAGRCDAHGADRPGAPLDYEMVVAFPHPDTIGRAIDLPKQQAVSACGACRNFIRDDAVARDFGWTTGMCAAKGKLILPNRHVYEARDCSDREVGLVRTTTDGIHLLPEYDNDFGRVDVAEEVLAAKAAAADPAEYPTDKPVSPEDQSEGIIAWRKVHNLTGQFFTYLPVYDERAFDEEDRALVPKTGDDEHPELYVDHFEGVYTAAVCWAELDETPAFWGEPGTGKTELGRHLAWLMRLPFRRISITASTELDDLAGKMLFVNNETTFQYGRLPKAWSKPGVICIDEPNVGPPDVWQFIRPLTDNSKQLVLDQNKGETISRHADAYLMMAMNPAHDARNVGAMQIGDADANRLFHIEVPMPPERLEREIIRARVSLDGWEITDEALTFLMKVAHDVRGLIDDGGTLPISWAIRPQIKVARALRWFDPITAYRRAVADYLEPEAQQMLLDAVRTHVDG